MHSHDGTLSSSSPRPLWYLARGGLPTPAGSKRRPRGVAWEAREGDAAWTPIVAIDATTGLPGPQDRTAAVTDPRPSIY